jgi:hypothetical protein
MPGSVFSCHSSLCSSAQRSVSKAFNAIFGKAPSGRTTSARGSASRPDRAIFLPRNSRTR